MLEELRVLARVSVKRSPEGALPIKSRGPGRWIGCGKLGSCLSLPVSTSPDFMGKATAGGSILLADLGLFCAPITNRPTLSVLPLVAGFAPLVREVDKDSGSHDRP